MLIYERVGADTAWTSISGLARAGYHRLDPRAGRFLLEERSPADR